MFTGSKKYLIWLVLVFLIGSILLYLSNQREEQLQLETQRQEQKIRHEKQKQAEKAQQEEQKLSQSEERIRAEIRKRRQAERERREKQSQSQQAQKPKPTTSTSKPRTSTSKPKPRPTSSAPKPTTSSPPPPPSGPGTNEPINNEMAIFKWPPPKPSTFSTILIDHLALPSGPTNLGHVEGQLRRALDAAGYYDVSYYVIEAQDNGFVIATRLEKIDERAQSVDGDDRWVVHTQTKKSFSLGSYIKDLFFAKQGSYRIILFTVSDRPVHFKKEKVSAPQAGGWVSDGSSSLSTQLKNKPFTENHQITALIYEFEKRNSKSAQNEASTIELKLMSSHQTRTHLERACVQVTGACIWPSLSKQ